MKTVKLVSIVFFISIVAVGFSQNDRVLNTAADPIKISLEKACQSRGLVYAINNQLLESVLNAERTGALMIFAVRYNNKVYHVYATYKDWQVYFDRLRFVPPTRM